MLTKGGLRVDFSTETMEPGVGEIQAAMYSEKITVDVEWHIEQKRLPRMRANKDIFKQTPSKVNLIVWISDQEKWFLMDDLIQEEMITKESIKYS